MGFIHRSLTCMAKSLFVFSVEESGLLRSFGNNVLLAYFARRVIVV